MRFYTSEECDRWLGGLQRAKPDEVPDLNVEHIRFPSAAYRYFYFAHWIATSITYRMPTLLWVVEFGIWGSSENLHLYYRLRESYEDKRLLHEAPGHMFLEHEAEDLASFLQLAMLNGWGGYVPTQGDYVNAFFSHDEYFNFYSSNCEQLEEVQKKLGSNLAP